MPWSENASAAPDSPAGLSRSAVTDAALALALQISESRERADPLAYRLYSSDEQRQGTRALLDGLEVMLRFPNIGGKTEWGSAMATAIMQGRRSLDGRTIHEAAAGASPWPLEVPRVDLPAVGYFITPGYAQSLEAGISAMKKQLGDYPWKPVYVKGESAGYISAFLVKPKCKTGGGSDWHSDDPSTWSRMTTFVDKGIPPEGGRIDFAWGDEHPSAEVWREIRMRRKANRPLLRWLTVTPLDRTRWEWLRSDYADHPDGKCEVVMHHISRNQALSPEHVAEQMRDAEGDPLKLARLFAEYVDTTGLCPFDYSGLQLLREWADPGRPWWGDARVEIWRDRDPRESYWVLLDPSSGKLPGVRWVGGKPQEVKRDRCGLWVVARRARAGVARLYDYAEPDQLARIGMELADYYNRAMIVPEMNGGWGEAMLPVWRKAGYANIYREFAIDRNDFRQTETLGWYSTADRRAAAIGALQRQIRQCAEGKPFLDIPSAAAVDSLMGILTDERGHPTRRHGQNWEDMILLGMAAYLLEHPAHVMSDEKPVSEMTGAERFEASLQRDFGRKIRVRPDRRDAPRDRWR